MIRKAVQSDIQPIAETYDELLTYEEKNGSHSNWKLGVYPTAHVAEQKVADGTMYVLEERGELCASMVLDQNQAEEYAGITWSCPAPADKVLVIHTLCIPPAKAGHGYGTRMIEYAKQHAREKGCTAIRLDTYAHNEPAKRLYLKNGFQISGYGRILLQGLIEEEQVYLECEV